MEWTPQRLSELATGYWGSQALLAAVETGMLDRLPGTAAEVCAGAGVNLRTGTFLLDSLVALGLVAERNGSLELEPSVRGLLTSNSPTSMVGALRLNSAMYGLWGRLPDLIRSGQPVVPGGGHLGSDPARTRAFVLAMHSRGLSLLPPVADALNLAEASSLLDVGSGAGTLGRLLAERHPSLRVTLLDLPGVTEIARELTAAHPCSARVTHLAADYFRSPLPGGYDAVVHCGALHQHDRTQAGDLVRKLAGCLRPGGRLFIVDLMSGSSFSSLFALNMALVSETARVHSPAEVREYLSRCGLGDLATVTAGGTAGLYTVVSGVASP